MKFLSRVPPLLVVLRVLLGPILLTMATSDASGVWLIALLITALLSDVFDGILARHIGVATERLRVADTWADGWFYLWVCKA